ncbi:MAG: PilZ domain-containing protein [Thermoanaerobaculia bacterium]|nr:PilZ domain-containing protein [Thermoanaerobaculia bacterium]
MERRKDKRWPRQLDAKFGKPNEKPHHAVATNISLGGAFLRTPSVLPSGTRLRVEFVHSQYGFVVEAVVVRAIKTPSHLQQVRPSGMGMRFIEPAELVESMLPSMAVISERVDEAPEVESAAAESSGSGPHQLQVGTPVVKEALDFTVTSEQYRHPEVPHLDLQRPVFAISYRDLEQMKQVFERDIKTGGIFVPSPAPEPLDAIVQVEVGIVGERPVRVDARVVHCQKAGPENEGVPNMLVGMGVQFTDPARAILLFKKMIFG